MTTGSPGAGSVGPGDNTSLGRSATSCPGRPSGTRASPRRSGQVHALALRPRSRPRPFPCGRRRPDAPNSQVQGIRRESTSLNSRVTLACDRLSARRIGLRCWPIPVASSGGDSANGGLRRRPHGVVRKRQGNSRRIAVGGPLARTTSHGRWSAHFQAARVSPTRAAIPCPAGHPGRDRPAPGPARCDCRGPRSAGGTATRCRPRTCSSGPARPASHIEELQPRRWRPACAWS